MWLGVIGAVLIGLSLGLFGSGGSILTVPVLTYLLGHEGKVAVAESLAIVGGIALIGMVPFARAINPVTKTNWEGTGVEPDVKVPASEALDSAIKAARERLAKGSP